MDFESPDVEKDFPGLYASESGRKSNESDFSEGDHDKPSKKDLLGRRKDKKESKKDRGYAALEGESSPEEDTDTNRSPSKSKKTKSFKFPTKSKEKREKSRDKEKVLDDASKQKELNEREKKKEKEREKEREKEKREKEKREKLKEKDKEKEEKAKFKLESKEKLKDEKKDKIKDKDKDKLKEKDKIKDKDKNKKLTKVPSTVTSGVPFEEIFTLGVALPIFGVSLQHSVERSRCHDDTGLPLLVRDSIDYLQAYGLKSNQIYRTEPDKIKLQQLRKLYTDRESTFPYHWDVPVACAILKSYISELPESILTQELHGQFEQATAIAEPQREATMQSLIAKLPNCNHSILGWLMRHFESVVANEQYNNANVQTIATAMGPALNMSLNLLTYFIAKADKLFPEVDLSKYVPPLQSLPAEFPDSAQEISAELRKQESLLSQIHAEMHAGFITQSRDHQLWEAQRIVTQLKRKLRSVQKSVEPNSLPQQPSLDEKPSEDEPECNNVQPEEPISINSVQNDQDTPKPTTNSIGAFPETIESPQANIEPLFNQEPKFNAEPQFNADIKFAETNFNSEPKFDEEPIFNAESKFDTEPIFNAEFEDNFEFKPELKEVTPEELDTPTENVNDKPKLTEKELKVLRLELENAEYLQLKSLLQAKINSEQFEIVKLRSHVALKSKQEGNVHNTKEIKDYSPEELELSQKLLKENALLEQKRLTLINQIFQERVACLHLKIELAMKEILSKS